MDTKTRLKTYLMITMMICGAGILALQVTATAAPKVVPVEGASYNVGASLAENLKTFTDKKVSLILESGTVMTGTVKDVGDHLVHLEKLDRKEYFDALIQLDEISAMETRFRQQQR